MEAVYALARLVHIAWGSLALLTGPVAMLTSGTRRSHRVWGKGTWRWWWPSCCRAWCCWGGYGAAVGRWWFVGWSVHAWRYGSMPKTVRWVVPVVVGLSSACGCCGGPHTLLCMGFHPVAVRPDRRRGDGQRGRSAHMSIQ